MFVCRENISLTHQLQREGKGVGIWAVSVLAFDRGSRQQDMESLKVSFSSLKMEIQREGRRKKKKERERQDGGNIWRNKTSAKPCDNMKGLEILLREAWTHTLTQSHTRAYMFKYTPEVEDGVKTLATLDVLSLWQLDFILAILNDQKKILFLFIPWQYSGCVAQNVCTNLILSL